MVDSKEVNVKENAPSCSAAVANISSYYRTSLHSAWNTDWLRTRKIMKNSSKFYGHT